jgi:hypothetical protein
MKAVTDIPSQFCLGFFAEKERSAVEVKGEFCIKMGRDTYVVTQGLSFLAHSHFPGLFVDGDSLVWKTASLQTRSKEGSGGWHTRSAKKEAEEHTASGTVRCYNNSYARKGHKGFFKVHGEPDGRKRGEPQDRSLVPGQAGGMGHNLGTRKAKKGKDEDEEKCDTCGAVAKEARKGRRLLKCPSCLSFVRMTRSGLRGEGYNKSKQQQQHISLLY